MTSSRLKDRDAKQVLMKWPTRTKLWPPPDGKGFWIRGQPREGRVPGPQLSSPGAKLFKTQPDGMWVHFSGVEFCDVVVVEVCGTIQNLNDKRSRYFPASHSLVLNCRLEWFQEPVSVQRGARWPRWKASRSFASSPSSDIALPVRHLRVLYAIPIDLYHPWGRQHTPTGYEYFCPHSSLGTYNSPPMQAFLRQMSRAAQFRVKLDPEAGTQ